MKMLLFVAAGISSCTTFMGGDKKMSRERIIENKRERMVVNKTGRMMVNKTIRRTNADIPKKSWLAYNSPEEAGYSGDELKKATALFAKYPGGALLVIHRGKVLLSAGETSRRYMLHSMRKSMMNAVYGANLSKIDTSATLAGMGINDINPLTAKESSANLINLMSSRSGIYLPSAYMPEGMQEKMPARGSAEPGSLWYYNNWDFNTLNTIFTEQTKQDFFESFQKKIANPLQMEDFRMIDTYYKLEPERSSHAAYLFKMSSRDLARVGLLYLRNGKWGKKQIIPEGWIRNSLTPRSTSLVNFEGRGGYGLLWWISEGIKGHPMYYSSGSGGHRICVFPTLDLVVVHRPNTYQPVRVPNDHVNKILEAIIDAQSPQNVAGKHSLKQFNNQENTAPSYPAANLPSACFKDYTHPQLGKMTILLKDKQPVMDVGNGYYRIVSKPGNMYLLEDMDLPIQFIAAKESNKKEGTIEIKMQGRTMESGIAYY